MFPHGPDRSLLLTDKLFEFLVQPRKGGGILLLKGSQLRDGSLFQLFQEIFDLGSEARVLWTILHAIFDAEPP